MTKIEKKTQVLEESFSFLTEVEMLQVHGGAESGLDKTGDGCSSAGKECAETGEGCNEAGTGCSGAGRGCKGVGSGCSNAGGSCGAPEDDKKKA